MADLQPAGAIEEDWYAHSFDALYPIIYAHRSVESAQAEVAFAVDTLQLGAREELLDLCCGNGRHMVHLLRRSARVCGLDYSRALLAHARGNVGEGALLVRGDMRALPFRNAFDAVLNFFTSFGYFTDEKENQQVLQSLACALRPGGRFLLDYLNPDHVEAHLVPRSARSVDGYDIGEERWIDPTAHRINKITNISTPEGKRVRTSESVRLYSADQMIALCEGAGLEVSALFGDYDGSTFGRESPRMILTGRKAVVHG